MVVDHTHPAYVKKRNSIGKDRWNGAYYSSLEICNYFIPNVKTDRDWLTIDFHYNPVPLNRPIAFVHNHPHCPEWYEWLKEYDDVVLVCTSYEDLPKLAHIGRPVYLPLSVDVPYVKKFRVKQKTREVAFAGRPEKLIGHKLPENVDCLCHLPREKFLQKLATYKRVYAVDRVEIEARILGCEVLHYGYPSFAPEKIVDSREAAKMLQEIIDEIDGVKR